MDYKMMVLDIDGTLMRKGYPQVTDRVAKAVKALQKKGVIVAVATGRTYFAMSGGILNGIRPDYAICSNGAQVLDQKGNVLASRTMTPEEMYALVDYCEDYDDALCFCFEDGYYAYVGYETIRQFYQTATGHGEHVKDGEDQDRHLKSMPLAAFCCMPLQRVEGFREKYGYLGLQFMPYAVGRYDVVQHGLDKAVGLSALLEKLEMKPEEVVAVGDNQNDLAMIRLAGLGVCMENGDEEVKRQADRLAPACDKDGVALLIEELFGK